VGQQVRTRPTCRAEKVPRTVTCTLAAMIALVAAGTLAAQSREQRVREDKRRIEAEGYWHYNDAAAAFAEARSSAKPMLVVLRCLPCVECVKLDDELIDRDPRIQPLLSQFVRLRLVSTNGLDLALFQFDTDQSFAVFFLSPQGDIYGRFGTRSHTTEWTGDVSIQGLAKAMRGALDLHAEYPGNRSLLAGKKGPAPRFASPELLPSLKDKYKSTLNYEGNVVASCIHCHQIGDAVRELALAGPEKMPENILFPYPHPKSIGLIMDPDEMATVREVAPDSAAARSGFLPGDVVQTLGGQPLLSIADVQWVLHQAVPQRVELPAVVVRRGVEQRLTLRLEKGWRRAGDISWRASSWELRRATLGGMVLVPLREEQKEVAVPERKAGSMALLVQHVGEYAPHDVAQRAGVRKGDLLVAFDARTDLLSESEIIAYALWEKQKGDRVPLKLIRDGKPIASTLEISR